MTSPLLQALIVLLDIAGCLLIYCGLWMVYPPAALIVSGCILLFAAYRIANHLWR